MLRWLHHWVGVGVAAWLAVISITGLLLLWTDEYVAWRYPSLPADTPLPAPDAGIVERIVAENGVGLTSLAMPSASRPVYQAYLAGGGGLLYHPSSGELLGNWSWHDSVPAFLFELHAHLLAGEAGHTVIGVLGMLALFSLLSGAWLWLRRRRIFRLRHAVPRGKDRSQLLRAHVAQGAVLFPLFVISVLSGIAMVFPQPFQSTLNGLLGVQAPVRLTVTAVDAGSTEVDWAAAFRQASRQMPDAAPRFLMPPREAGQPLVIRLRKDGELHPNGRSYIAMHPQSAQVLETIDATRRGLGPAVYDALYPIHAGKTGWPGHRILLASLALSLLFISISGLYLFLSRTRRHRSPESRRQAELQSR